MKQTTLEEKSAGGVVYRAVRGISNHKFSNSQIQYEFLVGKHSGYHKWVLPKGLVERGESAPEAAVREIMEEAGADLGEVSKTRRVKKYQEEGGTKTRIHKQVMFYLMEVEKDLGKEGWEMEERNWVNYEEGMKLLAFESEREVLGVARKEL